MINIPQNALDLIDDLIEQICHFESTCIDCIELDGDDGSGLLFIDELDVFRDYISNFGYIWCELDPFDFNVSLEKMGDSYLFKATSNEKSLEYDIYKELGSELHKLSSIKSSSYVMWQRDVDSARYNLHKFRRKLELQIAIANRQREKIIEEKEPESEKNKNNHPSFLHSDEYLICKILRPDGSYDTYHLTSRQAEIVKLLHDSYKSGFPDMSESNIMAEIRSSNGRMQDAFRSRPGYIGGLIIKGNRPGFFRLNIMETKENNKAK